MTGSATSRRNELGSSIQYRHPEGVEAIVMDGYVPNSSKTQTSTKSRVQGVTRDAPQTIQGGPSPSLIERPPASGRLGVSPFCCILVASAEGRQDHDQRGEREGGTMPWGVLVEAQALMGMDADSVAGRSLRSPVLRSS